MGGVHLGILGGSGVGSSTLTCCVTLSQLFPNYTPWEVTRILLGEAVLLAKNMSEPSLC